MTFARYPLPRDPARDVLAPFPWALVLLAATLFALAAAAVPAAAQGGEAFAVEVQTASRASALEATRERLAGEPAARIEKTSGGFRLVVGRWSRKADAEAALRRLTGDYPRARVVTVTGAPSSSSGGSSSGGSAAGEVRPEEQQEPVVRYETNEQGNVSVPEAEMLRRWAERDQQAKEVVASRANAGVEEALWADLRRGRFEEVERGIEALEARDPAWKAPAEMRRLLAEGRTARELERAVAERRWRDAVAVAARPEARTCRRFDNRWALARAYQGLGDAEQARKTYEEALTQCTAADTRRMTLERGLAELPDHQARLLLERSRTLVGPATAAAGAYAYSLARLLEAQEKGDEARVGRLIPSVRQGVLDRRDGGLAVLLGWNRLGAGDLDAAAAWFDRGREWADDPSEAAYGRVLVHMRRGEYGAALDLARRHREQPKVADVMDDLLMGAAGESFAAEEYRRSLDLLAESEEFRRLDRPGQMMRAWSLYHLGDLDEAVRLFEVLIETADDPSDDSRARLGLMSTLAAREDWAAVADLAAEEGAPEPPSAPPLYLADREGPAVDGSAAAGGEAPEETLVPAPPVLPSGLMGGPGQEASAGSQHAAIATLVGWSHHHLERHEEAETWFRKALADDPESADAAYGLAMTLLATERSAEAVDLARRFPAHPALSNVLAEVLYGEAQLAFDEGDYRRSVEVLEEASRYRPATREQRLSRGWALFKMQQYEPADEIFTALYRQQPDAASVRGLLYVRSQQGDWEGVAEVLDEAPEDVARSLEEPLNAAGENPAPAGSVPDGPPDAGADPGADPRALTAGPEPGDDESGLAVVIAWSYFHKGEMDQAERWFRRALERSPQLEEAAYGLGLTLLRQGDVEGASALAASFPESERIRELRMEVLLTSVQTSFDAGEYARALEALDQAGELRPLERPERTLRAWTLFRLDRLPEAREAFTRLFREEAGPESAEGLLYTLARMEDDAGVVALVERLPPAMVEGWRSGGSPVSGDGEPALLIAWSYQRREAYHQAAEWFRAVLARRPASEEAAYGLALSRHQRGDAAGALEVIRSRPDSERMTALAMDVHVAAARTSYEENRYEETLRWLSDARAYGPLDRPGQLLQGWALYRLGRIDEAARLFESSFDDGSGLPGDPGSAAAPPRARSRSAEVLPRSADVPPPSVPPASARPVSPSPPYIAPPAADPDAEVDAAFARLDAGRVDEAAEAFEAVLAERPRHERARYGLGVARFQQGRLREAEAIARSEPSTPELEGLLGRVLWRSAEGLYENQRYRAALDRLEEGERYLEPGRDQLLLKAWCLYQLGEYPEASKLFESLYDDAASASGAGEGKGAEPAGKVAEGKARRALHRAGFGAKSGAKQADKDAGREVRRKGRELRTRKLQAAAGGGAGGAAGAASDQASDSAFGLALSLQAAGDLAGAEEVARRYPYDPRMLRLLAELRGLGIAEAFQSGRYEEVLTSLDRVERSRALSRQERSWRAWSLYNLERYDEAAQTFRRLHEEEAAAPGRVAAAPTTPPRSASEPLAAPETTGTVAGVPSPSASPSVSSSPYEPIREEPAAAAAAAETPAEPAPRRRVSPAAPFPWETREQAAARVAREERGRLEARGDMGTQGDGTGESWRTAPPPSFDVPGSAAAGGSGSGAASETDPPSAAPSSAGSAPGSEPAELTALLEGGGPEGEAGVALALAWIRFEQGSYLEATRWFERTLALDPGNADALYGMVLCFQRRGEPEAALNLARRYAGEPRMARVLHDALVESAAAAYEARDYRRAYQALEEARGHGPLTRDSRQLQAWTLYHLGRMPAAAEAFEGLYREGRDVESAEGLYYALEQLQDRPRFDALARELGGPLVRFQAAPPFGGPSYGGTSVGDPSYGSAPQTGYYQQRRYQEPRREPWSEPRPEGGGWDGPGDRPRAPEGSYGAPAPYRDDEYGASPGRGSGWGAPPAGSYPPPAYREPAYREPSYQARSEAEQRFFDRKLFLRAAAIRGEDAYSPLFNVDSPSLALGAVFHRRSGLPGLDELDLGILPYLQGRLFLSPVDQLDVFVNNVVMDSGELPPEAPIGAFPVRPRERVYNFAPTTELRSGQEVVVRYLREGRFAPYAEIGTTPTEGALDSQLFGRVGFDWHFRRGYVGLAGFRQPVRESLLSYTGLQDPYSGSLWGGVMETGGQLTSYLQLAGKLGAFLEVTADHITGERVARNDHVGVHLTLPVTWNASGFDSVSLGPYVFYDSWDLNLGRFTLGHGGYFSPQDFLESGLALQFITEEARRFTAYGRLAVAYQDFEKDPVPVLPLAPDGRFFPAEEINGGTVVLSLKGLWRTADRFQLGGGVGYAASPRYDYYSVSLLGRWLFKARPALFSTDLPGREVEYP